MSRKISVEIVGDSGSLQRAFQRSSRAANTFDRDLGRTARGALAASFSIRGLGRAAAFSSAQFLGGVGIVYAIKSAIGAATRLEATTAQARNAVQRSGQQWSLYSDDVEKATLAESSLSGFTRQELLASFTKFERLTGNVSKALRLNALAANVARGATIPLADAANKVARASVGQARGLAIIGVNAKKGASGIQLITAINEKFSNSARRFAGTSAGAQARFSASLENTKEIIGQSLLPTVNQYLNKATAWLDKSKNQERVQRDVTEAVRVGSTAIHGISTAIKTAADAVGGFKNAFELLIALKVSSMMVGWGSSIGLIGTKAATSATRVGLLRAALLRLGAIGAITVAIEIVSKAHTTKHGLHRYSGKQGWANLWHDIGGPSFGGNDSTTMTGVPGQLGAFLQGASQPATSAGRGGAGTAAPPARLDRLSQLENAVSAARVASARKDPGAQAQLVAALKAKIDFDRKYEKIQQGLVARGGKDAKSHAKTLQSLYADETSALVEINGMQDKALTAEQRAAKKAAAAAKKRRDAAKKAAAERERQATTFEVPIALQIAAAKAATTTDPKDDIAVARKIKSFAEATIKSNKKKGQALVDAWNEIANQMQKLGTDSGGIGTYHHVSTASLTRGLHLTRDQTLAVRERQAQRDAHRGYVPSGPAALGNVVHIHLHGVQDVPKLASELDKHARKHGRRGGR